MSRSKHPKVPNHGPKLKGSTANSDHARRWQAPAFQDPEIEARLEELVKPAVFAELGHYHRLGMRNRILSLPVMISLVLTMMWRNVPSVRTLVRMLREERMLWSAPTRVSQPALAERFLTFPAELVLAVYESVIAQLPHRMAARNKARPLPTTLGAISTRFAGMYALDGSTLEALFRKLGTLQEEPHTPLGGHMVAACDLLTRLPARVWHADDPATNDKMLMSQVHAWLQEAQLGGSLLCFDLGYFAFTLFDDLTERGCYYVTRLRQKTRYTVEKVLMQRPYVRDCIISMGIYRSNPCRHPARLVEVCIEDKEGKRVWYQYLTNVLDPSMLSVEEVVEVYRNRWCIETAFKQTKRLLGLSYLWVGSRNGVELQVWGTWLFYAVLLDMCDDVAALLKLPLERISVEMTYRGLYHYVQALHNGVVGKDVNAPTYLAHRADWLGIVKHKRTRPPNITDHARAALLVTDTDLTHLTLYDLP
jgi:Transposase DDE domain